MNARVMAVQQPLCKDENVGFMDLWDCFCRKRGHVHMYLKCGLVHFSGKGAVVFADGLKREGEDRVILHIIIIIIIVVAIIILNSNNFIYTLESSNI